jgi:hypothetical protein
MNPFYTDKVFRYLSPIVFSNLNYKLGYFFTDKFLPFFLIKAAKTANTASTANMKILLKILP